MSGDDLRHGGREFVFGLGFRATLRYTGCRIQIDVCSRPVKKSTKRLLTTLTAALVTAFAAFVIVRLISAPKDLRSALAAALHVPANRNQDFFINLPPAGSRYPGAILVAPQMLVLEQSSANDTGITEGTHFSLIASDSAVANALSGFSSNLLSTAGRDNENVEVVLKVSDGRVLEMPVADLKQRLLSSQSAQSAANKGTDPVVITRAYSGILAFTLRQKSSAGARLIANAAKAPELNTNGSIKLDASKSGTGQITIEVAQPVVFAFEASSARFITNHLGGGPDDVSLTPIRPSDIKAPASTAAVSAKPWILASISSGYYQHIRTSDQPWNSRSADAVESAFRLFNPQSTLRVRANRDQPLTTSVLNDFVAQIGATAKQAHSQFILTYYIGHSLSWPNGDIALVLGEAAEIPEPKRGYTNQAISERVGEKVGALFQLADALNANLEKLPPGYMPLRDLYSELDKIGIPFALLVDGCLRNDEFEQFRNSIGLTRPTLRPALSFTPARMENS